MTGVCNVARTSLHCVEQHRGLLIIACVRAMKQTPHPMIDPGRDTLRPRPANATTPCAVNKVYAYFSANGSPVSLVLADPSGSNRKTPASNDFANIYGLLWSPSPQVPFAATQGAGIPSIIYFDPESEDAKTHKALTAQLPGLKLQYVDHSEDGNTTLIYAYSDRDPGAWYVFDRKVKKLSKLLAQREDILAARMGQRRPLRFKTSDDMELAGFMTIPEGIADPSNLPTVLLPHGGPHADGDDWSFDTDAQFLARRATSRCRSTIAARRGAGAHSRNRAI